MEGMIRHLGETIADDKATKAQKKLVYSMVKDGMRAAHIGTTGRRFRFNTDWADKYLRPSGNARPSVGFWLSRDVRPT